jgi:hypothetical protein
MPERDHERLTERHTVRKMLRDWGGTPEPYIPPKSRPLREQVALLDRIVVARTSPLATWESIAAEEGVPLRTLQHFYRTAIDGAGPPAIRRRPGRRRTRRMGLLG